jgi:hypothetical protein
MSLDIAKQMKLKYPIIGDMKFQKKIFLKKEFRHEYSAENGDIVEMDKTGELCQKDDILIIYAGGSSKKEIIARTVAQICNIETIRTIGDFVPNIHACSYSGKTLNIRD